MVIHLRRALADDSDEVPEHFEGVPLKSRVRLFGWSLGLALAVGGVTVMVKAQGSSLEAFGALCAAGGALVLAGVVRCRRYEIQVGRVWLKIGAGPLTHRIKRDLIREFRQRAATGWRRLYSEEEFELTLSVGDHQHVVPSLEPEELRAALDQPCRADSR